jgi:hypothetical protein
MAAGQVEPIGGCNICDANVNLNEEPLKIYHIKLYRSATTDLFLLIKVHGVRYFKYVYV